MAFRNMLLVTSCGLCPTKKWVPKLEAPKYQGYSPASHIFIPKDETCPHMMKNYWIGPNDWVPC